MQQTTLVKKTGISYKVKVADTYTNLSSAFLSVSVIIGLLTLLPITIVNSTQTFWERAGMGIIFSGLLLFVSLFFLLYGLANASIVEYKEDQNEIGQTQEELK